jgi:hypothetical protein
MRGDFQEGEGKGGAELLLKYMLLVFASTRKQRPKAGAAFMISTEAT